MTSSIPSVGERPKEEDPTQHQQQQLHQQLQQHHHHHPTNTVSDCEQSVSSNNSNSNSSYCSYNSTTTASTPARSPTVALRHCWPHSLTTTGTTGTTNALPPPPLSQESPCSSSSSNEEDEDADDVSVSSSQAVAGDVYSSSRSLCWSSLRTLEQQQQHHQHLPQPPIHRQEPELWRDSVRSFLTEQDETFTVVAATATATLTDECTIPSFIHCQRRTDIDNDDDDSIAHGKRLLDDALTRVKDLQNRLDASDAMVNTLWIALQQCTGNNHGKQNYWQTDKDHLDCHYHHQYKHSVQETTIHCIVTQGRWLLAACGVAVLLLSCNCCLGFGVLVLFLWFNLQFSNVDTKHW